MEWIRFQAPVVPRLDDVQRYFSLAEDRRWFSNNGPCAEELARRLGAYVGGAVHAVPVANATTGLLIALRAAAGSAAGSYVVLPSYTFVATLSAVLWAGFKPYYLDIDRDHWHADPVELDRVLTQLGDSVSAALLCSTYGAPPPKRVSDAWNEIATSHGVPLILDSAAGFGSQWEDGAALGTQGDLEVFSFHATKPFAIGEGGAVLGRDPALMERVRRLQNFGFDDERNITDQIGINGKLDELHAATALCVLDGYQSVLDNRRLIARFLRETLADAGFIFQQHSEMSAHQFLPMICESKRQRDAVIADAAHHGLELRAYFATPLHALRGIHESLDRPASGYSNTEYVADRVVCLPVYSDMSVDVAARIAEICLKVKG